MPVSRGRRRKEVEFKQPLSRVWRGRIERWLEGPRLVVTAFTTLGTIGGVIYGIVVPPLLDIESAGMAMPFAVPIRVTNRSWLLAMEDAELACGVKDLRSTSLSMSGVGFIFAGSSDRKRIGRFDERNFQCRITNLPAGDVVDAEVDVWVKFKNFGVTRISSPMRLTWLTAANPPRWVKGEFNVPPM